MSKIFKVIVLSLFIATSSMAGSDGQNELSKNTNGEVKDCFETVNRGIFAFNQAIDGLIFEPLAKGYLHLPSPIRTGTSNFVGNLSTLLTIPNHLLQGQWKLAGESTASFAINSTVGVLGFANPAAKLGLENQQEDVGQTLGAYGIGGGCYFVLPVLGPTTIRDSFGMVADSFVDPFAHVTLREKELANISGNKIDYFSVQGASAIDFRADNMTNFDSLEKNSLDEYAAIKSLYLQNRSKKISNTFSSDDDDWDEFNK